MKNSYEILLCLSGGKDSCSLAFMLREMKDLKILAFTNNVGFMSQTAWDNIMRTVDILDIDHIVWKSNLSLHQRIIDRYFADPKQTMFDVCYQCSLLTQQAAFMFAKALGIKKIVMGFTKYDAALQKTEPIAKKQLDDITVLNPYYQQYNLDIVKHRLHKWGIETDPTKTNCLMIERIIKTHIRRFGKHPFQEEAEALFNDKQITQEEKEHYLNFGADKDIPLQNGVLRLESFNDKEDFEYLLGLIPKYKLNKLSDEQATHNINRFGHLFWTLCAGSEKVGVVYTSYIPGLGYTIDGYRENETAKKIDNKKSFSYEALKLVTDYMLNNITDILWTAHDVKNRAATILCKRYKYEIDKEIDTQFGRFILMFKRRQ